MSMKSDKARHEIEIVAERYSTFCFDPVERERFAKSVGRTSAAPYAVVFANHFLPIDDAMTPVLRKWAADKIHEAADREALRGWFDQIEASVRKLHKLFRDGESNLAVQTAAAALPTWPAVGVAETEDALRSLLILQFTRMRDARVSWKLAEGSTYPKASADGTYLLVNFARYG